MVPFERRRRALLQAEGPFLLWTAPPVPRFWKPPIGCLFGMGLRSIQQSPISVTLLMCRPSQWKLPANRCSWGLHYPGSLETEYAGRGFGQVLSHGIVQCRSVRKLRDYKAAEACFVSIGWPVRVRGQRCDSNTLQYNGDMPEDQWHFAATYATTPLRPSPLW